MINIVIPMAGLGSRFSYEGNNTPKTFFDVNGKPMFVRVIEKFASPGARFILITRKEHIQSNMDLIKEVEKKYNAKFIAIENVTEGTVCTVLYSREDINNDIPLLIAMSDVIVDFDMEEFLNDCSKKAVDGHIMCFHTKEPKSNLSYALVNDAGYVTLVKEKEVISNLATAGVFYFSKGKYFINGAIDMIINNDRINNEFYVAPVYNYLISQKMKIGTYNIDIEQFHHLGTKEMLEAFKKHLILKI